MLKFIELNEDKIPMLPKGEKVADHFKDSMDGMENAGIQLPLEVVVLDFDGYNDDEEYFTNWIKKEYDPFWVKTIRGIHFYFKKPKDIKFKNAHCLTWIGLQTETKVTVPKKKEQTYCHPMIKQFGKIRESKNPLSELNFSKLPELPKDLYPLYISLKRKNQNVSLVGTAEGSRNNVMNEHLFFIRSQYEIDGDELWEYTQKINETMFMPLLEDKELKDIFNSVMKKEIKPIKSGRNNSKSDEEKKKERFTIQYLEKYIKEELHASVFYDVIKKEEVWSGNINFPETINIRMFDVLGGRFTRVCQTTIDSFLNCIILENRRNKILELIQSTEWDQVDRLPQLFEILHLDDEFDQLLMTKWLRQSLTLLLNSRKGQGYNFQPDGCLVLNGEQGWGKTSFFRHLCSFAPEYFKEGAELNKWNKDKEIEAIGYWITELGELEGTIKKSEVEDLKNFITRSEDEIRVPYGRRAGRTARTTSFCATCNGEKFLRDVTGNRRFWTIKLNQAIRFKDLQKLDSLQLWVQIWKQFEISAQNQEFRLDLERELPILNERNKAFEKELYGEEEVMDTLTRILALPHEFQSITTTEWKDNVGGLNKYTSNQVGIILERYGYPNKLMKIAGKVGKYRELPMIVSSFNYGEKVTTGNDG